MSDETGDTFYFKTDGVYQGDRKLKSVACTHAGSKYYEVFAREFIISFLGICGQTYTIDDITDDVVIVPTKNPAVNRIKPDVIIADNLSCKVTFNASILSFFSLISISVVPPT